MRDRSPRVLNVSCAKAMKHMFWISGETDVVFCFLFLLGLTQALCSVAWTFFCLKDCGNSASSRAQEVMRTSVGL